MLGVVFAGISVAMLALQYYSQVTVVRYNIMRGELEALSLFVLGNPHSFFWPLECLGYGFMSLSTLFVVFTFSRGSLERWIRLLFIANGARDWRLSSLSIMSTVALCYDCPSGRLSFIIDYSS
jgi:hypothetical protein